MIRARFMEEQPEIHIVTIAGRRYVYVCKNGEKKVESFQGGSGVEQIGYWEYDYCEGVVSEEEASEEEIRNNIEWYLSHWEGAHDNRS